LGERLARQLLDTHTPRSIIRDRLILLGFSERTAYRMIEKALNQHCQNHSIVGSF